MEQEKRDAYVLRYGEEALRRRDIHARFAVFASERLEGPQGEKWGRLFEVLMQIENSTEYLIGDITEFFKPLPKSNIFPIWRTVHLVPEADPRITFATAIEMAGMKVSDLARDLLAQPSFTVTTEETEVRLCCAMVKELTGHDQATTAEILDAIRRVGELCPAEVGPQLRVQYADQPMGEYLLVGMEPVTDSDGYLRVFSVAHESDGQWLRGNDGNADNVWDGDLQWVFVARN